MKIFRLITFVLICAVFTSCSTTAPGDPTGVLKYGTKMTAVQKKWGEPDETMAFQDYRAKEGFVVANSRFAYGETSTPTKLVWTYKDKGKVLFFEKRGLFFDERHTLIMVWTLVGWEKLQTKTDELPTK